MPSWNVKQYEIYEYQRLRPALDLLHAIALDDPQLIYDVGCGTGNVTSIIKDRWPNAKVIGFDSSPDMISKATTLKEDIEWKVKDIDTWRPEEKIDLIFSNAVFHWLPDHKSLFTRLMSYLADGGVLAVQMPNNFAEATHTSLEETVHEHKWSIDLERKLLGIPVASLEEYYDIFSAMSSSTNMWSTQYLHTLDGDNPVTEWIKGSAMRPILDALPEAETRLFLKYYAEKVQRAYPKQSNGKTLLFYNRVFIISKK